MIIKLLFYKPVIDFGLGRIGFTKMLFLMLVRWGTIMLLCLTVLAAYLAFAPGIMTGKLGAPDTQLQEREAREAAFSERGGGARRRLSERAIQE